MSKEEKVSYREFRKLHKGRKQKEISELWAAYKEGEYTFQTEESTEETVSEAPVEEKEDVTEEQVEEVQEESEEIEGGFESHERRYIVYRNRLARFRPSMNAADIRKMELAIEESALATRPRGYHCTPTDTWKLWMDSSKNALLINNTRNVAFIISRGWWQQTYVNAVHYVDRSLLEAGNTLIQGLRKQFDRRGRLVKRPPLEGVEIMLPRTRREYQRRDA